MFEQYLLMSETLLICWGFFLYFEVYKDITDGTHGTVTGHCGYPQKPVVKRHVYILIHSFRPLGELG